MSFLLHGCYDLETLDSLKSLGINHFAFDLRGKSLNLIPFNTLKSLIQKIPGQQIFLTFENDRKETILSFLDLLKNEPAKFMLLFRDFESVYYYSEIARPFYWMYHPKADWQGILSLPQLQGIFLPIKWKKNYQDKVELWNIIDARNLPVFLHAENFREAEELNLTEDANLSIDLTSEIELTFRRVDQIKLKKMKIWRKLNEDSAL